MHLSESEYQQIKPSKIILTGSCCRISCNNQLLIILIQSVDETCNLVIFTVDDKIEENQLPKVWLQPYGFGTLFNEWYLPKGPMIFQWWLPSMTTKRRHKELIKQHSLVSHSKILFLYTLNWYACWYEK
jgi:hypothetical protein